jgi:excisionase family DNA binding protein
VTAPQPPRPDGAGPKAIDARTDGPLALTLPVDFVERVAFRVAAILAAREPEAERWVGVAEAAEHLSCPRSRIYALTSAGRLPHRKDGTRLLFRLSELDAWLERGGGRRP